MTEGENRFRIFNKTVLQHLLFWSLVFVYYLSMSYPFEDNKSYLLYAVTVDLLFQVALTYIIIEILIPKLLNKNKKVLFFISIVIIIYVFYFAHYAYKCFYLAEEFKEVYKNRPPLVFLERITDFYSFVRTFPIDLAPSIMLSAFNYYKKEKETASLLEQKKTTELDALRNQLNPHFLFNTLNNLYALALKKSDKTPEVIAKLSDILDYILYRCQSNYVSLKNEVTLLHNYIALEKVRYGNRVEVVFKETIHEAAEIAPLLLLTFLENAFKHGVSQEINTAIINISIFGDSTFVEFKISNTKPNVYALEDSEDRNSIGLQNIKKQLNLLYPNKYKLEIENTKENYSVRLKVSKDEI